MTYRAVLARTNFAPNNYSNPWVPLRVNKLTAKNIGYNYLQVQDLFLLFTAKKENSPNIGLLVKKQLIN